MVLELKFIIKIIKFVKIMCRLITCTLEINWVNYCNHSIIFVGVKIIMSYPKLYDSCLWTRYMCVNKTFNKLLYLVSNVGMSKLKKGTFIFYTERGGKYNIYLPWLQRTPVHPPVHVHVNRPSFFVKVPPFWHELSRQWLISKKKQKIKNDNKQFLIRYEGNL